MNFVFQKYQVTNDVRICKIIRYVFRNTNIFLISGFSDLVSPWRAASAAGLVVNTGTIMRSSGSEVNLETTILSSDEENSISLVCISKNPSRILSSYVVQMNVHSRYPRNPLLSVLEALFPLTSPLFQMNSIQPFRSRFPTHLHVVRPRPCNRGGMHY